MNPSLLHMMKRRDQLFRRCKKAPANSVHRQAYVSYRSLVSSKIREAKNNYFKNLFLRLVFRANKAKTIDDSILKYFGQNSSAKKIADDFARSFDINHCSLSNIIDKLNNNKPPGCDKIRESDSKMMNSSLSPLLVKMINLSLESGTVPNYIKETIIHPVYKGGSVTDTGNYRPIAILSVLHKVLECHVAACLSKYIKGSNLYSNSQFGFREKMGTADAILHIFNFVYKNLDAGNHVLVLFIDFKKAFDILPHASLLENLKQYGIVGTFINWFSSYLLNRNSRVKLSDSYSDHYIINYWVPQGSILGPTLLNLYLNDMPNIVMNSTVIQYADDSLLLIAHNSKRKAEEMLQYDFNLILNWAHDRELVINSYNSNQLYLKRIHSCPVPERFPSHYGRALLKVIKITTRKSIIAVSWNVKKGSDTNDGLPWKARAIKPDYSAVTCSPYSPRERIYIQSKGIEPMTAHT
ncbi:hypothetical protein J437_LFUL006945 [Ladona fulva]|uniref:Reverse transcriptase domain-containing protein n=1 Tax=Ladona fulva TaxID=123851 RepID=A0A8K0P559_LADFU|nr:hypothetical protein J437_LFUL006945 [Ladona fulva]